MEGADGMTPLEVSGLVVQRGARTVLTGVDLDANRGDVVALMGLSGAGKSTVLRVVAGLEPFSAGAIRLDDVAFQAGEQPSRARVRSKVGMVFQAHCLFEHLSAIDNVRLALLHVQRMTMKDATARAESLMEELDVRNRSHAWPRELSGGEAQRVAIARALALDPPVLLLDEPTASLDPARRGELGRILKTLATGGRALLVTSHDDDFVADHATRVVILAGGRVVEQGNPRDVLGNPSHEATRELLRFERSHADRLTKG
jgi:ABC-type polar amino acid transport system ATPase subunit